MKKYILLASVVLLVISLFNFNVVGAQSLPVGCTATSSFSTATGEPCSPTIAASGCPAGASFSSLTGEPCPGAQSDDSSVTVSKFQSLFKSNLKIGAKGNDVKALQQLLRDEGYYFGKVDGKYGKITARAAKDFQDDNDITVTASATPAVALPTPTPPAPEPLVSPILPMPATGNSPVISGVSGSQNLYVGQVGKWVVRAYDRTGGDISYSVSWEDGSPDATASALVPPAVQQSATFSHTYITRGNYTVVFTFSNAKGQSAKSLLSVRVDDTSDTATTPSITPPVVAPATVVVREGCASGAKFSSVTGLSCDKTLATPVTPVNPVATVVPAPNVNTPAPATTPNTTNTALPTPNTPPVSTQAISITTPSLPNGKVGSQYLTSVQAAGSTASYVWTKDGDLPAGLTLSKGSCGDTSCENISGTPSKAGTYAFYLAITSGTQSASKKFTVIIDALPSVPVNTVSHLPTGTLDTVSCDIIGGWGYDSDSPTTPISIHIYDGGAGPGTLLTATTTTGLRGDVNAAFSITGNHGFTINTPSALKDGKLHTVYGYAIDSDGKVNADLAGSPKSVQCAMPVLAPVVAAPNVPVVSISANPTSVAYAGGTFISWSSTNATSCSVDHINRNELNMVSFPTGGLTTTTTYTVTCKGSEITGGFKTSASTTITVGSNTVSTPTQTTPAAQAPTTSLSTNTNSATPPPSPTPAPDTTSNNGAITFAPSTSTVVLYGNINYGGGSLSVTSSMADLNSVGWNDQTSSIAIPLGMSVTVFADSNFTGASMTLNSSQADFRDLSIGNDSVSSIRINSDSSSPSTNNTSSSATTDTQSDASTQARSDVSSATPTPPTPVSISDHVILYENTNQGGRMLDVTSDIAKLSSYSWNDRASSIYIPAGFVVSLWGSDNFSGDNDCLDTSGKQFCHSNEQLGTFYPRAPLVYNFPPKTSNSYDVQNDELSSIRVTYYAATASAALPASNVASALSAFSSAQSSESSSASAAAQSSNASFHFTKYLEQGSEGAEVTELQKALHSAGFYDYTIDGIFGSRMKAALIKFQSANGLKADGIAGYEVRTFLNK